MSEIRRLGIREFVQTSTRTLHQLERDGRPVLLVRHRRPVAFLVGVGSSVGEDLVLAYALEIAEALTTAERERIEGRATEWPRS